MIEKIIERQISAINKFGFLTSDDLFEFVKLLQKEEQSRKTTLQDKYFDLSDGWQTDEEHRIVSEKLANFIKDAIK